MTAAEKKDDLLIAAEKAFKTSFQAVLKLTPETGDALWVDGHGEIPLVLTNEPEEAEKSTATCVWRGARESLLRALSGERAFESAFVSGRIAVSGDMSVMTRLKIEGAR